MYKVKILSFTHELTDSQKDKLTKLLNQQFEEIVIPVSWSHEIDSELQIKKILSVLDLKELQKEALIINPAALSKVSNLLLVALHGILGYFPSMLEVSPVVGSTTREYEITRISNLAEFRESFRALR